MIDPPLPGVQNHSHDSLNLNIHSIANRMDPSRSQSGNSNHSGTGRSIMNLGDQMTPLPTKIEAVIYNFENFRYSIIEST